MTSFRRGLLLAAVVGGVVSWAPAAVDAVSPTSLAEGTEVTVTGAGFGTSPAAFLVDGTKRVALARSKKPKPSDTEFHAVVKKTAAGAYTLEVKPKGAAAAFSFPGVTVERPHVDQVTPASAAAGERLTIHASFLGKSKGSVFVGCAAAKVKQWNAAVGTVTVVVPVGVPVGPAEVVLVNASREASDPAVAAIDVTSAGGTGQAVAGRIGPDCFAADQKIDAGDDATVGSTRFLTIRAVHKAGGVQQYFYVQAEVDAAATFPVTVSASVHYVVSRVRNQTKLEDYQSSAADGVPVTIDAVDGGFIDGSFGGTLFVVAGQGTYGPTIETSGRFHAKVP